jgi:hypothetical protein
MCRSRISKFDPFESAGYRRLAPIARGILLKKDFDEETLDAG